MYFYKYLSSNTLNVSMLRNGEVFFASPKELNDIHECRPQYIFSAEMEVWSRFIRSILVNTCIKMELEPDAPLSSLILSFHENILKCLLKGRKAKSIDYQPLLDGLSDIFVNEAMDKLNFKDARKAIISFKSCIHDDLDTTLNDSYYVSSFSKNVNNLTMWGHYGGAEKGFAIIYETNDGKVTLESDLDLFPMMEQTGTHSYNFGISNSIESTIMDVAYKNKPVRANGFRRLINTFSFSSYEQQYDYQEVLLSRLPGFNESEIGWVKYTDWKYEKEMRLHLPVYNEIPAPLRSVRIHPKHIKGIIFGSRATESDKENILSACYHLKVSNKNKYEIFVLQAKTIPNQYKIKVNVLGRIPEIHGFRLPFIEKLNQETRGLKKEAEEMAKVINLS
ncbi:DUF2971 domain-containing protein [Escherichia coli]|nr:DUF2971 domain-containing protein [Escherichia coli]